MMFQVAGEHQIYLSFGSEPIPGSPFACKVYDVEAIKVRQCEKGIVGKPVTFLVETSRAGPGNLEVTGAIESQLRNTHLNAVILYSASILITSASCRKAVLTLKTFVMKMTISLDTSLATTFSHSRNHGLFPPL